MLSEIKQIFHLQFSVDDEQSRIVGTVWVNMWNKSIVLHFRPVPTQIGVRINEVRHLDHFLFCS